jgi:hypothetical protein
VQIKLAATKAVLQGSPTRLLAGGRAGANLSALSLSIQRWAGRRRTAKKEKKPVISAKVAARNRFLNVK